MYVTLSLKLIQIIDRVEVVDVDFHAHGFYDSQDRDYNMAQHHLNMAQQYIKIPNCGLTQPATSPDIFLQARIEPATFVTALRYHSLQDKEV